MENKTLQENLSELNDVVQSYLSARLNLVKVILLEKIAKIGVYLFTSAFLMVAGLGILLLLSFAFSFWYGERYGSVAMGFLIATLFYTSITFAIYGFRRQLFANNIIRNISKIFFEDENEPQND